MATIALTVWPLPGAINGVLALARRLRERGHRVCVIGIPDAAAAVEGAGLPFEPVLAATFPPGFLLDMRRRLAELGLLSRSREIRRWTRRYDALARALLSGGNRELDAVLDRIAPDLVLINPDVPQLGIVRVLAERRGVPFAYVTPLFHHYAHPRSPPLSSPHRPTAGPLDRWRVRLMWGRHRIARRMRHAAILALGLDTDPVAAHDRQRGTGAPNWGTFLAPLTAAPEFLLSAAELDFDAPLPPGSRRIGFVLDPDRDGPFPWDRLNPARRLLYCSLGTLLYLSLPRQRDLLQAVIDAASQRPDWQLVMATGAYVRPGDLAVRGREAVVIDRVPQVRILQRAAAMITHAGVNSVHECAHFGVPMVLLPIAFDQPGCAARMVHHGLGVRGDPRRATAAGIGRLIDAAAAPEVVRRCRAMQARMRRQVDTEDGLRALEALATGR